MKQLILTLITVLCIYSAFSQSIDTCYISGKTNIYSKPEIDSEKIQLLERGTIVVIKERIKSFFEVDINGVNGYVQSPFINCTDDLDYFNNSVTFNSEDIDIYFEETNLDSIDVQYIEIVGYKKFLSTKLRVEIEIGQNQSIWNPKSHKIKNQYGEKIDLNSMIDALNLFYKKGWEFVANYVVSDGGQHAYHYLLQKRKE